jgi:hypothetical protein
MKNLIPEQNRRISVPYKSKKNRRSVSPNRVLVPGPAGVSENVDAQASINQPAKTNSLRYSSSKAAAAVPIETHFLNELKWITVVAVIIVILMIGAYYIFR